MQFNEISLFFHQKSENFMIFQSNGGMGFQSGEHGDAAVISFGEAVAKFHRASVRPAA
jgi:hypothetical protein